MRWNTKNGHDNKAAYALSRIPHSQLLFMAISSVQTDLMEKIQQSWEALTSFATNYF